MPLSELDQAVHAASILVVDDIPANVEMLTGLLDVGGFTDVKGTTDPKQGLSMVEWGAFDLILLDMRMPEIDGQEFIRRVKASDIKEQPAIVVLTAQTDEETRKAALSAGARDFIIKPFKLWEMLQRVRNTLEIQVLYRRAKEFNDVLETRVQERTRELDDSRIEVIQRLATAAEFRDNETGQHIQRMSALSHHLALASGFSPEEAARVRDAAPLHDVGKIGIPDAILLKPGKLVGDEWETMKRHAEIGAEILSNSKSALIDLACTIARTHHEKWDGSGYPRGLKGEEIPLVGRIIALTDVFDALTSARPYKPAWTIEKAVELLVENSGKHFDPELTKLFVQELPTLLEIRGRFLDDETHAAE